MSALSVGYRSSFIALAIALALAFAGSGEAGELEVYSARHRSAEELLPIAETALEGRGRVVVDRRSNALVLSGDAEAIERALSILSSLDIARRTIALRYESVGERTLRAQGIDVDWSVRRGPVRIGNVRGRGDGDARIELRLEDRERRRERRLAGRLRILEGETGRISTGSTVPVTSRRVERGPFGPIVQETTELVQVDSGFEASPRVLGDGRIELVLRPFEAELRRDGSIDTSSADTRIVLEPGTTVALGGLIQSERRSGRDGLLDARESEAIEDTLLLITAELE